MPAPALRDLAPIPWQAEALGEIVPGRVRVAGWAGGVGSGKSLTICAAGCMLAQTRPGTEWVLGMDTYPRLEKVHLPLLRQLQPAARWYPTSKAFEFRNGSVLRLQHLDYGGNPMDGDSPIEGGNLSGVLLDECQAVDPRYFKVARMRARIPFRGLPPVVILSGLPINRWWLRKIIEAGGRTWTPRTADNLAHLDPEYVANLIASLTERERRAYLDGEELPVEGQVLYGFSGRDYPDGNVLRGHRIDFRSARTMLSGDLGYRSPAFLLWVEVWPGVWCVIREWAPDRTVLPDLCDILSRDVCPRRDWAPGDARLPVDELVVDPAGDAMNDQTGHSDLELLARMQPAGLGLWPIVEAVPERRRVATRLQRLNLSLERRIVLISGRLYDAGLAAPDDHRTLIRSIQGYAWDPRNPAKPRKDGVFDHHVDGFSYGHRRIQWDALPPDPTADRQPAYFEPSPPIATLDGARDAR